MTTWPGGVQLRVGVGCCAFGVGAATLLWVARLAQLATETPEPQLIAVQVMVTGAIGATMLAFGVWTLRACSPGSTWRRVVLTVSSLPPLVLLTSVADVMTEVCQRPGGACG